MSLIKNMLKYVFILVGLVALGAAALAAVMFFVPSVQIFGYRFKSSHKEYRISLAQTTDMEKITVKTSAYNIRVVPSIDEVSPNTFYVVIKNNYTGYSNSENDEVLINGQAISGINKFSKDVVLENEVDEDGNVVMSGGKPVKVAGHYVVDLTELSGILSLGGSCVELHLPQSTKYIDYSLQTKSGTISFPEVSGQNPVKTNNLNISVTSARGTFSLDNVEMVETATLEVENFLGRININSNIGGSVKISSKTGSFYFNNIGTEGVSKIEDETDEVMLLITGANPFVSFKKLNGSLKMLSSSGMVQGEIVEGDIISTTTNAEIKISKLLGGCNIQTQQGVVHINQIGESVNELRPINITTTTGEVKLGHATESGKTYQNIYGKISSIVTTGGKVSLYNVMNNIDNLSTQSGKVDVEFVKDDRAKNANITTKSGAITISNINGNIYAKTENSSPINASYYLIGGKTEFITDDGNINVTLFAPTNDSNRQYLLKLKSKSNKFDCQIGNYTLTSLDESSKVDGYYQTQQSFPSSAVGAKILSFQTNTGKIIVRY